MHDRGRTGLRQVLAQPGADVLDRLDLARLVEVPEPFEAAQLAFQVAGRLAEALQAHGLPVDGVDLDERVDQLLGDAPAFRRRIQVGGDLGDDRLARHALHHVERRADHGLVVAHREHVGHPGRGVAQRSQQPRLAQNVVRARRNRRPRRPAQHQLAAAALEQVGDVRVALADRAREDLPGAQAVGVEEAAKWLEHEQRRALVVLSVRSARDDVVCCNRRPHDGERYIDRNLACAEVLKIPCPDSPSCSQFCSPPHS